MDLVLRSLRDALRRREIHVAGATRWVGWPGALQPPAPADPGVTVSRHRAPLTSRSVRADPAPVGEQAGISFE